jgi:hypothetical protein
MSAFARADSEGSLDLTNWSDVSNSRSVSAPPQSSSSPRFRPKNAMMTLARRLWCASAGAFGGTSGSSDGGNAAIPRNRTTSSGSSSSVSSGDQKRPLPVVERFGRRVGGLAPRTGDRKVVALEAAVKLGAGRAVVQEVKRQPVIARGVRRAGREVDRFGGRARPLLGFWGGLEVKNLEETACVVERYWPYP